MISGRALAAMQRTQQGVLTQTVEIRRAEAEADGYGGVTQNWRTVYNGIAARLMPARLGRESTGADRITESTDWDLTLAASQEIHTGDRVVYNGTEYEVVSTNEDSGWVTAKRAMLRLIT